MRPASQLTRYRSGNIMFRGHFVGNASEVPYDVSRRTSSVGTWCFQKCPTNSWWSWHENELNIQSLGGSLGYRKPPTIIFLSHGRSGILSAVARPKTCFSATDGVRKDGDKRVTAWWFGTLFVSCHHPNWLIFFRGVETFENTKQVNLKVCFELFWQKGHLGHLATLDGPQPLVAYFVFTGPRLSN